MVTSTDTQQTTELRRPIDGRMIAGVAAGLGNRFSINPWWFRVGLILLALVGGLGLALYAIGWLLIPEQGADGPILANWISGVDTTNTAMVIGIALIAFAALILATTLDLVSGQILFAAVLFVIGVLLYRGDIGRSGKPTDPNGGGGDMPNETQLVDVETTEVVSAKLDEPAAGGGDPPEDTLPVPAAPPPPIEAQPRSILGHLTVAAMLIALGGLALLDVAGVLAPGFVHYVALALGVVGGGLLVGTFFGRARGLIIVGLLLTPLLFLASVVPTWSLDRGAGDEFFRPVSVTEIEAQKYELAAGSLHLDLTDLAADPGSVRIPLDVSIGAGEIRIDVRSDTAVFVEGSVGIGGVDLFGDSRAGIGVSSTAETGPIPVFVISAKAGVGNIVVRER